MLRVIYTEEAGDFHLGTFGMDSYPKRVGDTEVEKLKAKYTKLRTRFPDLSSKIGVVTFDDFWKVLIRRRIQELRDDDLIAVTSYLPLDILEATLRMREEEITPISKEYLSRMETYLAPKVVLLHDGSRELLTRAFSFLSYGAEVIEDVKENLTGLLEEMREHKGEMVEENTQTMERAVKKLESWDDWEAVEALHTFFLERFRANGVSRDFPLHYHSVQNCIPPYKYLVNLEGGIEFPEGFGGWLDLLQKGAEAMGLEEVPEREMESIMSLRKDRFGKTEKVEKLEDFLARLEEPRTVITDVYFVDFFPQFAGDIETFEYREVV